MFCLFQRWAGSDPQMHFFCPSKNPREQNILYDVKFIHIATNHSNFGGILPLFTQYSAIPIGMTKFRQN